MARKATKKPKEYFLTAKIGADLNEVIEKYRKRAGLGRSGLVVEGLKALIGPRKIRDTLKRRAIKSR